MAVVVAVGAIIAVFTYRQLKRTALTRTVAIVLSASAALFAAFAVWAGIR